MTKTKICGITGEEPLQAAITHHADFIGLVFYAASPRAVTPETAQKLAALTPPGIDKVGLFVEPDDDLLAGILETVDLDFIQLHGEESPDRVAEIKAISGKKLIKALRIGNGRDVRAARAYEDVADWLLFDASVPGKAGGTGKVFNWALLDGQQWRCPWMLAGGLHTANVREAIDRLRPDAVDVSSGVEDRPGVKNPHLIAEFVEHVRQSG